MIFIVRGPDGQRRVEVDENRPLGEQMKVSFGVQCIAVSLEDGACMDLSRTPRSLDMRNGQVVYVEYEKANVQKTEPRDNTIKREKDSLICQHDANAMCSNCAPLDPWDEKYYKDNMIKYLSFGSYCEMLKSKKKELVVENYSARQCTDHGPNARCSRCQEKNIVLMPQVFRMVDHVEFDNQSLVENFIRTWRDSGRQRFGLLVGKYMAHEMVPMGIKAVVSGVWEPEQEDFPDGFVVSESMDDLFSGTGLHIVGMIYTDLQLEKGVTTSTRVCKDYFLSSLEIQFMAKMQLMYPHVEGGVEFNSRFATIVVTADCEGCIVLREYQVSSQCMALVRSDHIVPTEDPEKFLTTRDIVYRTWEREAMTKADPYLPGDFFIVRLTHGCKQSPLFANDEFVPKKLTAKRMAEHFKDGFSMERFSNFNLLTRMRGLFSEWRKLFKAVLERDRRTFEEISRSEDFAAFASSMDRYRSTAWACGTCTFVNEKNTGACEMCGASRD